MVRLECAQGRKVLSNVQVDTQLRRYVLSDDEADIEKEIEERLKKASDKKVCDTISMFAIIVTAHMCDVMACSYGLFASLGMKAKVDLNYNQFEYIFSLSRNSSTMNV